MKIKKIVLYNIGPYVDVNTFDFSLQKGKNIVLIGGKNGAGKTTFFKAIKTCLYGCRVWGFDAPGKEYLSIISNLVNFKTLYENTANAYIEVELIFDDGKQVNTYLLHREWRKNKSSLSEFFNIKKNDDVILASEEDDFVNYLLSVIPPDMFNFYFFDGESIAEFFLGTDGNKNFKNAFLKLYGLDTLSIMIDNFTRNIKKTDSKDGSFNNYINARQSLEEEQKKYSSLCDELSELKSKVELYQIKIKSLQSDYSKDGGISLSEWKDINGQLSKEENHRENLNRWLKEVANHYLPFIILEKNLNKLLGELVEAEDYEKTKYIVDLLSSDSFVNNTKDFLSLKGANSISAEELIAYFKSFLNLDEPIISFDFSSKQIERIIAQIYEKFDFDKSKITTAVSEINKSLRNTKKLRDLLTLSSVEGYSEFIDKKDEYEKSIAELSLSIERKTREIEEQRIICDSADKAFKKARESYELILKNNSVNDLSERAAGAYTLLVEQLVTRQAKILQEEFLRCFNSIINKDNFIDGLVIDKNINVIPYKYIYINRSQLENYKKANSSFLSLFNNPSFIISMNELDDGLIESAQLPSPITAPFSQGERQVYIMSIYLALLKTSHKDIPFFIDTPFARIDSKHRANIVNEFFNGINNQLFILSTDEEIVGDYKLMMEDKIADEFILSISDYGTTKIKKDMYFEV